MVTRKNGAPQQGVWVEPDVRFVTVTAGGGTDYLADLVASPDTEAQRDAAVNSDLEVALEILSTRGTLLGVNVSSGTVFTAMLGYAQAFTVGNTEATVGSVEEEVSDAILADTGATTSVGIVVQAGFAGAAPGTPT